VTGTAHFQSSIDSDEDAPTGYRAGAGAATIEAKLADKLADIVNHRNRTYYASHAISWRLHVQSRSSL